MTESERAVARHYARESLEQAIDAALRQAGRNPAQLAADDLAAIDEFHLGGRPATLALAEDLGLGAGERVLDLGSGLGGPARGFASLRGCQVTGIDLTADYVAVARALTRRLGLDAQVRFLQGSALALPFPAGSFDAATLIHVGMNIADKARLFAEARRVLRPGGRFALYEVMRVGAGPLPFPLPWAEDAGASFVETPETYRRLLAEAGLSLRAEADRRGLVLELMEAQRARADAEGPPPLGLHLLMPPEARRRRLGNINAALAGGLLAPVQMIAVA